MGRPVVHFEIGFRDSKKTQEFYGKMFGGNTTEAGPAAMIAPEPPGIGGHITALGHEPHRLHHILRGRRGRCRLSETG